MKLYQLALSPNSQIVRLVAHLAGVPLELIDMDTTKGETKTPDFLRLNPNGRAPVLIDGDFVLWESLAIATYLAALKPESGLLPSTPRLRADMDRWLFWKACHLSPAISKIVYELLVKTRFQMGSPDEKIILQGRTELAEFGGVLNEHLGKNKYLVGRQLSLADLALATSFVYRVPAEINISLWPHLSSWLHEIESLPSWKATVPVI